MDTKLKHDSKSITKASLLIKNEQSSETLDKSKIEDTSFPTSSCLNDWLSDLQTCEIDRLWEYFTA